MPTKKTATQPPTRKSAARKTPARRGKRSTAPKVIRPRKKPEPTPVEPTAVWLNAIHAAEEKKATDVKVLDLRPVTAFTDFLILCTGRNARQIQAIADEVEKLLKEHDERPQSVEGYNNAEWILMDYGDYVVNIFSEQARAYYDLERLWRDAPLVTGEVLTPPATSEAVP